MNAYLRATPEIDWNHPRVMTLAHALRANSENPVEIARNCFEWVRDEIKHSGDHRTKEVTCSASEVLLAGSGYCYAKSHLLAALLRANGLASGMCYQRMSVSEDGSKYCLHGLNAVLLPGIGWYRMDARGNKAGVNAQFEPPKERLAFNVTGKGEATLPEIWPEPLPVVVTTIRSFNNAIELGDNLPDVVLWTTG